jgi:hypothetical protein
MAAMTKTPPILPSAAWQVLDREDSASYSMLFFRDHGRDGSERGYDG